MKRTFLALLLILPTYSFAGAWDVGSFENDSALDWAYELESARSVNFLSQTFNSIRNAQQLDVDACSAALAAAEVVASIHRGSLTHLPDEVMVWAKKHATDVTQALKNNAAETVSKCADSKVSEIAQLWEESSPSDWSAYISELQSRLK